MCWLCALNVCSEGMGKRFTEMVMLGGVELSCVTDGWARGNAVHYILELNSVALLL